MLLINSLLVGGTLITSAKLYQENKRRKERPWTVYAERVGLLKKKNEDSAINKMRATLLTLKQNALAPFRMRSQQMEEIVGSEISEEQKKTNQRLAIGSANLALAGVSYFYPPLLLLVVPIEIYCAIPLYQLTYQSVFSEKRVSSNLLNTILMTGMLVLRYFYTYAIMVWFFAVSRKVLLESENNSKKKLSNLFGVPPRLVYIQNNEGVEVEIPFEQVQRGDIIMVSAGQTIFVDGVITSGFASIDQHKLTGESQPVEKGVGDEVLASTVLLAGRIGIRTAKTGEETVAMQIGKILNQTASFKNSLQSQGEAIADRAAPFTLGLSVLFYPLFGYVGAATVLTNEYGYKMRIFAPTSMLTFLNLASQEGILIKDGRSLDLLNQIDIVVFDKTGTLTLEQPTVAQIHTYHGYGKEDILRYAAAAEDGQTHPIAKAILTAANKQELAWPKIVDAKYEMGYGIQVNLPDRVIRVGSDKFMLMNDIKLPSEVKKVQSSCHEHGHSLVLVAFDDQIAGVIELHATIRPEAKEVISRLRERGMSMVIISGDHEPPTKKLAETLGIEHYFANTLPENKANLVSKLQEEGKSVCFVGDGINDSIALKKANVSVSLRGATMIATDTAQVVLMDGTLNKLEEMFDIAQRLEVNMKTNYYLSTIPCIVCIGGIVFFHWGLATGMAVSISALFAGISNSILPLLKQQRATTKGQQ